MLVILGALFMVFGLHMTRPDDWFSGFYSGLFCSLAGIMFVRALDKNPPA